MTAAYPGLAVPGATYPSLLSSDGGWFSPPVTEVPGGPTSDRLFSRLRLPIDSHSVLKRDDGTYYQTQNPTDEEVVAAAIAYLGGRTYHVDSAEKAALQAAGYEVDPE